MPVERDEGKGEDKREGTYVDGREMDHGKKKHREEETGKELRTHQRRPTWALSESSGLSTSTTRALLVSHTCLSQGRACYK